MVKSFKLAYFALLPVIGFDGQKGVVAVGQILKKYSFVQ
jgi:hypothetical protein